MVVSILKGGQSHGICKNAKVTPWIYDTKIWHTLHFVVTQPSWPSPLRPVDWLREDHHQ